MLLSDERRKVMESLILSGKTPDDIPEVCRELGVGVDETVMAKWQKTLKTPSKLVAFKPEPKLINRFSLGADPEFVMTDLAGRYLYAQDLGFDTLSAFGCDMSGRQAELRVYPSKSVLEIVASIVDTLRWMYVFGGNARAANWIATPYANINDVRDGVGGHIHFGRKRPSRKKEVGCLDGVGKLLLDAGVLDKVNQNRRAENTNYGRNGDYRPQVHGYEYRTLPTWLCSPEVAFTTMVSSKLSVLMPEALKVKKSDVQLKNLIYSFKHRDDDAAILTRYIERKGLPKAHNGDFKALWGVGFNKQLLYATHYIPESIPADKETMKEVFEWLVNGTAIPVRMPNATWPLFQLPKGYQKVTIEPHCYGTAEVGMGLLSYGCHVKIVSGARYAGGGGNCIDISTNHWQEPDFVQSKVIECGLQNRIVVNFQDSRTPPFMNIKMPIDLVEGHNPRPHMVERIRKLLAESGMFPIIHADAVGKVQFKETYLAAKKVKVEKSMTGRIRLEQNGGL